VQQRERDAAAAVGPQPTAPRSRPGIDGQRASPRGWRRSALEKQLPKQTPPRTQRTWHQDTAPLAPPVLSRSSHLLVPSCRRGISRIAWTLASAIAD
jgi:hypothetical protein